MGRGVGLLQLNWDDDGAACTVAFGVPSWATLLMLARAVGVALPHSNPVLPPSATLAATMLTSTPYHPPATIDYHLNFHRSRLLQPP